MVAPLHKSADFVFHQKEPPNGGPPRLQAINLLVAPSNNLFHAHAYRLFSPGASAPNADWEHALELGELSANSCICSIRER